MIDKPFTSATADWREREREREREWEIEQEN